MAQSRVKALLFDFGNTLAFLDYELLAVELSEPERPLVALELERAEYAGRAALDRFLMSGGPPDLNEAYRVYFCKWMEAAGIAPERMVFCRERFSELHKVASMWRVIRPGTIAMLERYRAAGLKLGVVSNAEGHIESDARRFGIHHYFDVIIDSHVVGVAKPDPRIFRLALERLKVAPEEALFAGDIYSVDMVGAHAAGIEGKLVDVMGQYDWVDHAKIRGIHELHQEL